MMKTITYTNVLDRSAWQAGPWDDEPADKMQWLDEVSGLPCITKRNMIGAWCGYVGVSPDHPLHGKSYDDPDVEVHGGLTYADGCRHGDDPAKGICHLVEPGEPDDVWWFGFDCAHCFDLYPQGFSYMNGKEVYRSLDFVRAECARLAAQLKP